jgi:transcription antitermination factor NusA-like protein
VRLASRLCGWDIDIKTREEFEAEGFARPESAEAEGGPASLAGGTESSEDPDEVGDEPTAASAAPDAQSDA